MALRMLNVQQPFAWALVSGHKDVENRSYNLKVDLPCWTLIVASKSKPTRRRIADVRAKLYMTCQHEAMPSEFTLDAVIGAVEFVSSGQESSSLWYEGQPGYAWTIGRFVRFQVPVRGIRGCLSIRFLGTYRDRNRIISTLEHEVPSSQLCTMGVPGRNRKRIVVSDEE
jgi:hypothetical protein